MRMFISDIPLTVTGSGKNVSYSAFPGFNPLTGWYAGSGIQGQPPEQGEEIINGFHCFQPIK